MSKKAGRGVSLRRTSQTIFIALVLAVFFAAAASAQWNWSQGSSGGWWSNQQPSGRSRAARRQQTYQPQPQYNPFFPSSQQPTAQSPRARAATHHRARSWRTPPVLAYGRPNERESRASRSKPARGAVRIPEPGDRGEPAAAASGGETVFCTRLCDGFFFPLSREANAKPEKICSALCPASDTKVFEGSNIDEATASDGSRYEKLKTAFLYRKELVADCTCNGRNVFGLAKIDIKSDPTLQVGDIVVLAGGLKVYAGTRGRRHHRTARFTPIRKSSLVSRSFRRTLRQIEIAKTRPSVGKQRQAHQAEPDQPDLTD
jgi:hypothetical protein